MAVIRVYLPTYRRPQLLPRAIESLRRQTFTDWICEVHNDAPDDERPAQLVAQTGDPRLHYVGHRQTLGPVATFNLFFRPSPEPFYSMLEDDNWWEPGFLETMLTYANEFPRVTVLSSNMRVWQEQPDGSFSDTGRFTEVRHAAVPQAIPWGQSPQLYGPIHSNGAMLVRSRPGDDFRVPAIPFAMVEPFRERLFPFPLLFVPEPLANFSLTLATSRSQNRSEWAVAQTMLAASFLRHAGYSADALKTTWDAAVASQPPQTTTLLLASLIEPTCRPLLRFAGLADWLLLLRGAVRRPWLFWRVLRSRRQRRDWWEFLDRHTAKRFREACAIA